MTTLYPGAPGHTQTLGEERPEGGQKWTRIVFMDRSALVVNWDGRYEVAGLYSNADGAVTVYCPQGRRLLFPWHRIDMIEHYDPPEGTA